METLSAGATTTLFKLPTASSSARDLTATSIHAPPPHYHLSSAPSTTRTRRSLTSTTSTHSALLSTKSPPLKHPHPLPFHRRASSGYAAALLDASQLGGPATLASAARDVARFSKLLRREEIRDFVRDGSMMKMIAERGGFCEQLKVVLDLLIVKGRVGIFGEVLDEFMRVFHLLGYGTPIGNQELTFSTM